MLYFSEQLKTTNSHAAVRYNCLSIVPGSFRIRLFRWTRLHQFPQPFYVLDAGERCKVLGVLGG